MTFKAPHVPVQSFEDDTYNWERITTALQEPWLGPESVPAKVENVDIQARPELDLIRFRGIFTALEKIASGEVLFTMPRAVRPDNTRFSFFVTTAATFGGILIFLASGEVAYTGTEEIPPGESGTLEGVTIVK